MSKKQLGVSLVIFLIILLIISIVLAIHSTNSGKYGEIPGDFVKQQDDYTFTDEDKIFKQDNYKYIYPEDVVFKEKMLTPGGMLPVGFKDEDGQTYSRHFFPAYGYAMYLPDNWTIKEHSNSYLQNTYYLITDQEDLGAIEIAVSTQTGISGKSKNEVMESFRSNTAGMEYYFLAGKYKLVTTMYKDSYRDIITANEVGFDLGENNDAVLAWYSTPDVTFLLDDSPYYYANPYVINYYVVMDDTAVMITAIGPKSKSDRMYHLLGATALNIRELKNQNATALHYLPEKTIENSSLKLNVPADYYEGYGSGNGTRIVCSSDRESFLYGTEIYLPKKPIKASDPLEVLMNHDVTAEIVEMCLRGHPDISKLTTNNLDYSISFSEDDVAEIVYRGIKYTKVQYSINIDTDSLHKPLGLFETKINNTIYINKSLGGEYYYVNFKYLTASKSYIDDLSKNVLANLAQK